MAWTAFQMQKIAYDKKIMEEKRSPGRRPVTHHARGGGRVRDAAFFRWRKRRRKKACRISLPADPAVCAPGVEAAAYRTFRLLKWGRYFLLAANILLTISRISARLRTAEVRGSKMMD